MTEPIAPRRQIERGRVVGLVMLLIGCGASAGTTPRQTPAPDSETVAPVEVGAMSDAFGIGSCELPDAPEVHDDCWQPEPAAAVIAALIDVWASRVDESEADEVLPTVLTGGLHDYYNLAADRLSLLALEGLMGIPVFSAGPHRDHPVVDHPERFGRYDPMFLARAEVVLESLESRGALTPRRRAALQDNVVVTIRTLLAIREQIDERGGLAELVRLWREAGSTFLPPRGDRERGDAWRESAYARRDDEIYEAVFELFEEEPDPVIINGVGFWVRRELGGNAQHMRALLQRALCLIDERYQ